MSLSNEEFRATSKYWILYEEVTGILFDEFDISFEDSVGYLLTHDIIPTGDDLDKADAQEIAEKIKNAIDKQPKT